MNWDSVINIGMFVLGTCFIIVATAQIIFMEDDDPDEDEDDWDGINPFVDGGDDSDDEVELSSELDFDEDGMTNEEIMYKAIDNCLEMVSEQIKEQDDIRVALIMVDGASFATQALVDKKLNDNNEL